MTTRADYVQRLVLDLICTDYENVDQTILQDAQRFAAEDGIKVTRAEVIEALRMLVQGGLAKAYSASFHEAPAELPGMPRLDEVEEEFRTWFLATNEGRELADE